MIISNPDGVNVIKPYSFVAEFEKLEGSIYVCHYTALDHIVKRGVTGNFRLHATFEFADDSGVAFHDLIGDVCFLHTKMPFFAVAQRFLQPFQSIKSHELLSPLLSCHHIRLCVLR